jgi:hypothetical protein
MINIRSDSPARSIPNKGDRTFALTRAKIEDPGLFPDRNSGCSGLLRSKTGGATLPSLRRRHPIID